MTPTALNHLAVQWFPALPAAAAPALPAEYRLLLRVDGELLLDVYEAGYGFDLGELVRSLANSGFYFILTCACGHAGCVGIEAAVTVVHQPTCIEWQVASPFTRTLRFDYGPYAHPIQTARKQLLRFLPRVYTALQEGDVRLLPDNYGDWPFVAAQDWG